MKKRGKKSPVEIGWLSFCSICCGHSTKGIACMRHVCCVARFNHPVNPPHKSSDNQQRTRTRSSFIMSSTKDYLSKYMSKSASSSTDDYRKKKSKKKKISSSSSTKATVRKGNFAIHDEDEVSWNNAASESEDDYRKGRYSFFFHSFSCMTLS